MERELIFSPWGDGLGDHLLCTPIPRLAKQLGYRRVYLAAQSAFRNPLYKKYLWECNPYLDGDKDAPLTFSAHSRPTNAQAELYMPRGNVIDAILRNHGLDDKRWWHTPEIYFKVAEKPEFRGATVFDPSYLYLVYMRYDLGYYKKRVLEYFTRHRVKIDYQLVSGSFNNLYLDGVGTRLECNDFLEYCAIIRACGRFYSVYSGSMVLAVALGQRPVVLYFGKSRHLLPSVPAPSGAGPAGTVLPQIRPEPLLRRANWWRRAALHARMRMGKPRMFKESEFVSL